MENCFNCDGPLFGPVAYCPYCGCVTGAHHPNNTSPEPAVETPAAAAAPVVASITEAHSSTQSTDDSPSSESSKRTERVRASTRKAAAQAESVAPVPEKKINASEPATKSSSVAEESQTAQPQKKKPRKLFKLVRNIGIGIVVVFAGLIYLGNKTQQKETLCENHLSAAGQLLKGGDLDAALQEGRQADQLCQGDLNAKATQLLVQIQRARADIARQCGRAYETATTRLAQSRLQNAATVLEQLPATCTSSPDAQRLNRELAQANASADEAEDHVRKAIATGDGIAAESAIDDLERIDRGRADLAQLRAQASAMPKPTPAPVEPASQPATPPQPGATDVNAQATQSVMRTYVPAPPSPPRQPAPVVNSQAALAEEFLNDAKAALAQNRFDTARTYADSARRISPNDPRIDALLSTIRSREHQVLQDETTIK